MQEPCGLFTPHAFGSQILNCIWICASLFLPWAKSSILSPHWPLQNFEKCQFSPSLSIKHIYILWLEVLSEEYFIFFLIALFAFNFLNFMVYMDVCVGVYLYTRVGWGFLNCMCWFHGHMIPTSCGSDWPGLAFVHVFVLLKNRVVFRKSVLIGSYERLLPLKMLVSCIICFKRIWEFHSLKDLHEGTLHRSSFGFPLMYGAYSNKDCFLLSLPPNSHQDLCAGLGFSPFLLPFLTSSRNATLCSMWQH